MKKFLAAVLLVFGLAVALPVSADAATPSGARQGYTVFAKPGHKIKLDADRYFIYGFAKPPKIGTATMKVEIFTRDGKRDTSYVITGDADMPSMRGAHSMGDKNFYLSKKSVYLLPVPLVMLGDWEISFTFIRNDKTVLRGVYLFDL